MFWIAVLLIFLNAGATPVSADDAADNGLGPSVLCMVKEQADTADFMVFLPPAYASALDGKGFAPVNCAVAFQSPSSVEAYRNFVCDLAANPSEEVQAGHTDALGEAPAVLCAFAEAVSGQSLPRDKRIRP